MTWALARGSGVLGSCLHENHPLGGEKFIALMILDLWVVFKYSLTKVSNHERHPL